MIKKFIPFFLGWLYTGHVFASTPQFVPDALFDKAWENWQQDYPQKQLDQLLQAAHLGNTKARWLLILLYSDKHSSLFFPDKAIVLLTSLADKGDPAAQFLLARLYLSYFPDKKDLAISSLTSLAEGGWLPAILLLAKIGERRYLMRAAEMGSAQAQYELAIASDDISEAEAFLLSSASQGYAPAVLRLAEAYQKQQNFVEALIWQSRAVEAGVPDSELELAKYYVYGLGVSISLLKAVSLMKKAGLSEVQAIAKLKNWIAERRISHSASHKGLCASAESFFSGYSEYLYECGLNEKQSGNYIQARELFYRSAALGYLPAVNSLGVLYEKGQGVEKDAALAEVLYLEGAVRGYQRSVLNLVELKLEQGDMESAALWIKQVEDYSPRAEKIKAHFRLLAGA